ncbi:hypothetical protein CHS0354_019532 [Potamilus streckersoni]|uniref:carbonyl reductase (NADPH) n=1 Tax=Potamilus streckersoni TaxID=2493646 RepID=A0AAE0SHY4_9BIVA|nr:hypothetical protein CHS0354_019532 [Potamilus streckersoni]
MASSRRVAIVTGSNKGIGFAIVRGLCKLFDGDVYLTARDENRGRKALADLKKEGLNPLFHQLDISDPTSIQNLGDFLQKQYGGLDLLVNNAAHAYKMDSPAPFAEQAVVTLKVNFWDTLAVCEALFPLLRTHARVVNMSSMGSTMAYRGCSDAIKHRIKDPNITMDQIKDLMREFELAAKADQVEERGFRKSAYGTSKIGVRVMSFIQQRELAKDTQRPDVIVNSCCPGYVATDMTSHKGTKTIDEGAVTPLYLALLPPNVVSPKGEFVSEKTVQHWPS